MSVIGNMKWAAVVALAATLGAPAGAADLRRPPPPPYVPPPIWTGFHVGAYAGFAFSGEDATSAFFGTPLTVHLHQLDARTLIICGESTSGCVRATAVDAFSHGFHVVLVEECCFDRNPLSHKINLFDLHHKYADVIHVDEAAAHLDTLKARKVS